MKQRFINLFVLSVLVFAVLFVVFPRSVQAWHTYDPASNYTLTELWQKVQMGGAEYEIFRNHVYLNMMSVDLFEELTGIDLPEIVELRIRFGGIRADFDVEGSSSTRDSYNEIGWHTKLGNILNNSLTDIIFQNNRCANHFYNGYRYNHDYERLTDFPAEWATLRNVSAYEWAFNSPDNNFDFTDAIANRGTADSWIALGEVDHLLGDMIVPDHSGNDTHIPGYGKSTYEEAMAQYTFSQLENFPGFNPPTAMSYPGQKLKIAFDQLQGYTSTHFFSDDTMFADEHAGVELVRVEIGDYLTDLSFLSKIKVEVLN